ncbi:hypothetical protein Tco_1005917 [Tanacetum coccineum]|uniref:Uncharacterized protein n=1 Tax=Tanacetum coccineum TaxID=301880 RepID=A0ABQ5FGT2_9ASTR
MPRDSPLPRGHTPGSDEGSKTLHELTVLCTNLSNKVESLETELKQTKQTYGADFTKLIKKDPSKQRRSMMDEIDLDAIISLVPQHVEVQGSTFVSTASPQRHADTTADDLTLAETLMKIRKSAVKAKGKAKIDETESRRKMK